MDALSNLRQNANEEITFCCEKHGNEVLPHLILEYLVGENGVNMDAGHIGQRP
jgi:hypothetical protein